MPARLVPPSCSECATSAWPCNDSIHQSIDSHDARRLVPPKGHHTSFLRHTSSKMSAPAPGSSLAKAGDCGVRGVRAARGVRDSVSLSRACLQLSVAAASKSCLPPIVRVRVGARECVRERACPRARAHHHFKAHRWHGPLIGLILEMHPCTPNQLRGRRRPDGVACLHRATRYP